MQKERVVIACVAPVASVIGPGTKLLVEMRVLEIEPWVCSIHPDAISETKAATLAPTGTG
ncbi:hypothetical protein ACV229_32435 [Burkholderia sp. MR1-5-21]